MNKIIILLKKCFKNNNIVYTCGNGGSSSLADHFACDFIKQSNNKTNLQVKSISLTSNFSLISAIANFGIVEDCHVSLMHYLSQYLRNISINNNNFEKINF